ncbi:MAG: M48 family metallopeptidase [Gammaproteobacteria bacterium]
MHWFTVIFLIALALTLGLKVWLARRQIRHVREHRERVPEPFDTRVPLDEHRKAADYTMAATRVGIVSAIVSAALLLFWTLGGGIALLDGWWAESRFGPLLVGVAVMLSVYFVSMLVSLPLDVYQTFGIETRFGFNRTTPGLFVADQIKGIVIGLLIGVPLLVTILYLMSAAGTLWWFYAWLVWVGFTLLITWAYPRIIAPLFNKFSPLDDSTLKGRIEGLLERCGFRSSGVFVMDGSKRSSHANAYFTGVGNNKRIVFFDTLLDSLDHAEIEATLAHELGHFRRKHVRKRLIFSFVFSLAGLALLGWLAQQDWFYEALGVTTQSNHGALLLFLLVIPVFTFVFSPLLAYMSRRHEFEADEYAADQSDASALISALVKLYRDNARTLTPDPLHSDFYDSHPPPPVRVANLARLAAAKSG